MKKAKVIIFDLDGTAVDSPAQKLPTERLQKAVRALEANYYLCAATGRVWSFAEPVIKGLGLADPCIISAGTQICDPVTGEILWQQLIEEAQLPQVLSIMKSTGYNVTANDSTEMDYLDGGWPFERIANLKEAYFLELAFVPEDKAAAVLEMFKDIPNTHTTMVVAQRPGMRDIHIMHNLANKQHAIFELCNMLEVDRAQCIGIGDGHNDMDLFTAVGHKVAMGNAVQDLKEASDRVIGSIQEDGLAEYFEELASAS